MISQNGHEGLRLSSSAKYVLKISLTLSNILEASSTETRLPSTCWNLSGCHLFRSSFSLCELSMCLISLLFSPWLHGISGQATLSYLTLPLPVSMLSHAMLCLLSNSFTCCRKGESQAGDCSLVLCAGRARGGRSAPRRLLLHSRGDCGYLNLAPAFTS